MPVFFNHLNRGRHGTMAGAALASLALALAVGARAARGPAASASIAPPECSWHPLSLMNGWQSAQGEWGTGNPSYCVTSLGMVYLSGSLTQPGGGPARSRCSRPRRRPLATCT
jgi:hypothetical protein